MSAEHNPMDDMPIDREEWDAAMKPETQPWMKDAAEEYFRSKPTPDERAHLLSILAAHAPQQWMPVSERLPESCALVTAYFGNGTMQQCFRSAVDGEFHYCLNGEKCPMVIAWSPLPAPPVPDTPGKEKTK